MKSLFIFPFLVLLFNPAFAQEEDSESAIRSTIEGIFNTTGDFAEAQINSSTWFDQQKKDDLNIATEAGVSTGKTALNLYLDFHNFIVNLIFAGSPVEFDRGIIVLVSFVVGAVLVFFLFWAFIKKIWKVALVLVAIVVIIWIAGIQFPSIS